MTNMEFTTAVTKEKTPLRQYAYKLTKNSDDANDLLQDTMLKAITNREKFVAQTNLKGWLYTIMKNSFINNYRRMVKQNTFIDQTDNTYYLDSMSVAEGNQAESKFMMRDMEHAIDTLPDDLKNTFMMNFTGYKYHEIADLMKIPIGTVKTRIFVARRMLRGKLSVYGQAYGYRTN
ncbi:MAG: RNA polymerase sigma factor [Flavobacteriaceae bacterium]|nr:RNA polymerase sigma factor [Flavobacteriaceae bacterium]